MRWNRGVFYGGSLNENIGRIIDYARRVRACKAVPGESRDDTEGVVTIDSAGYTDTVIASAVAIAKAKRMKVMSARERGEYCLTCGNLTSDPSCHDVRLARLDPEWLRDHVSESVKR